MLGRMETGLARQCVFFVTAYTHNLEPLLVHDGTADCLKRLFGTEARRHRSTVLGYVVMPDHFHLMLAFDGASQLGGFMQDLLQTSTRQLHSDGREFWRHTYEAVLITSEEDFYRKLQDVHSNPVRRNLCEHATDWEHSSASVWLHGAKDGMTCTCLARTRLRRLKEEKTQGI